MAQETGYEARVMPTAAAPLPMASARTYGAELADTVGQVAQDVHQREIRAYQVRRQQTADQESSDFAHRFALHKQSMDEAVREIRASPTAADYADHVERVAKADDDAREKLLDGITEDSVRRRAAAQLDDFRTRLVGSEGDFAEGQQIAKTRLDAQAVKQLGANRVRRSENGAEFTEELQDWHSYVDGLQRLTPAEKQAIRREGEQEYAVAFVNHLNDTNPTAALALLDAGQFDTLLSPQQIDQLRNGSQVEIRRAEAQLVQAANVEKAAVREQVATVTEKASQGIDVSAELPELIAKSESYGDSSTVAKLEGLQRESGLAKTWGAMPPLARDQRAAVLRGIPEAKRTEGQQAELKWLDDKKGSLDGQFNNDPVGFAAQTAPQGKGPPPIANWTRPELGAREQWMREAAGAYGSMQPLSASEARALQERAEQGDVGYRGVLATLSQFSPRTAMQAMRQVLPSDRFAQTLVALSPNVQRQAVDGKVALKANTGILRTPKDDDDMAAQVSGLRAGFAMALGNVPASQRDGIMQVAEAIAARNLEQNGMLSEQMSSAMLARSLDAALGATGSGAAKKGGLGWWGGKIYLLPDRVTQAGFEAHVTNYVREHKENPPVNPDGSPADLRFAKPLALGGGRYQFMVGNRVVMGKDGKPWVRTVIAK
ncbi:hypothetical protein [Novosphingobium sp. RL4]|uniref:hypothetical protein n=1 Tax=Novosphingobium sp. RL4 TaxID=3109595 RepID=UPI002D76EE8B|nr:hypothetical protein [Novosphingobium sp. RL4]WRT91365.1 hypothetical protein U9J33_08985 [Novosphingobium sp. RL4]